MKEIIIIKSMCAYMIYALVTLWAKISANDRYHMFKIIISALLSI